MRQIKVLKSTSIFTGTTDQFMAGGILIEDDKIIDVLPTDLVEQLHGPQYQVLDLGQQTILPGFIESHAHVFLSALLHAGRIKLISGDSEQACVAALQGLAQNTESADWLIAKGWYAPSWSQQQLPTKTSLDQAFPHTPVVVIADDLHTLWLNSVALAKLLPMADSSRFKRDVLRDTTGEPTGVVGEQTAMAFLHFLFQMTVAQQAELVQPYLAHLAQMGITSVSDLALLPAQTAVGIDDQIYPEVYECLAAQSKLPVRANLYPYFDRNLNSFQYIKNQAHDPLVRIAGGKLFFDGVTSSYTAWMKQPYVGRASCGMPQVRPDKMRGLILTAQAQNIALRIHAIGDQAIHEALLFFAEAEHRSGPLAQGHHCLEHLETIDTGDLTLMGQGRVVASVQPSHPSLDYQTATDYIGQRAAGMWPFKTFLQKEVVLAFGTDSPVVVDVSPLQNCYFAMTRQTLAGAPAGGWHAEQCLTLAQSLTAQTLGGAIATNSEKCVGTLTPGKQADICILAQNIAELAPTELAQVSVTATMLAGRWVFRKVLQTV
jgi:predicted amidohydrolase YtcJ